MSIREILEIVTTVRSVFTFDDHDQVNSRTALQYAAKHGMSYLEVSSLADYNITETFVDLSRRVLNRIRLHSWHENRGE